MNDCTPVALMHPELFIPFSLKDYVFRQTYLKSLLKEMLLELYTSLQQWICNVRLYSAKKALSKNFDANPLLAAFICKPH